MYLVSQKGNLTLYNSSSDPMSTVVSCIKEHLFDEHFGSILVLQRKTQILVFSHSLNLNSLSGLRLSDPVLDVEIRGGSPDPDTCTLRSYGGWDSRRLPTEKSTGHSNSKKRKG